VASAPRHGFLLAVANRLDALATGVGRVVAYFTVATVLICFLNVYLRYAIGVGFVWLQESYIWTHVAAIMFGSSYALLQGAFVRVDPFYSRMSERGKAWVDLFGSIVLLGPFVWMMGFSGWSFFLASWKMDERSAYESGLPAMYLLKGTLLIFVALVSLQGIAIVCRCVLTLLGHGKRATTSISTESF
jgi:TRAP-type mannitol/chloroaromatic compound transport system permease small subunit